MDKNKETIKNLNRKETEHVSGGYVVQVNPSDLEKENINLKRYLVVEDEEDSSTGKVIDSFDNLESAIACDAINSSDSYYIYKVQSGELDEKVFKSLDGNYIFKRW